MVAFPLNTPPATLPSFLDRPAAKIPPKISPMPPFSTLIVKMPSLMMPVFVTLHVLWKVPPVMSPVALFTTVPSKVPLPLMVP